MHVSYGVPLPLSVKAAVYEVVGCFKKRSHKLFDCLIIVFKVQGRVWTPKSKVWRLCSTNGPSGKITQHVDLKCNS